MTFLTIIFTHLKCSIFFPRTLHAYLIMVHYYTSPVHISCSLLFIFIVIHVFLCQVWGHHWQQAYHGQTVSLSGVVRIAKSYHSCPSVLNFFLIRFFQFFNKFNKLHLFQKVTASKCADICTTICLIH